MRALHGSINLQQHHTKSPPQQDWHQGIDLQQNEQLPSKKVPQEVAAYRACWLCLSHTASTVILRTRVDYTLGRNTSCMDGKMLT